LYVARLTDECNRPVAFGLTLVNVSDASATVLLIRAVAPPRCLIADKATRGQLGTLTAFALVAFAELCGPERVLSLRLGFGMARRRVHMTVAVH